MLLVVPPEVSKEDFNIDLVLHRRYWAYPPYGAGVLAKSLKTAGYEADILDLTYEILSHACRGADKFDYEIWRSLLREKIKTFQPDAVGITCMFTMAHPGMKLVAQEVKTLCGLPVIAGGVHVTNAREMVLRDSPHIDFIALYECDNLLPILFDVLNDKRSPEDLKQIATLIEGEYHAIEERAAPKNDEIISPDYCGLPIHEYDSLGQVGTYGFMRPNRPAASALAERGCRAKCSFCSVRYFNGMGVRTRNASDVVEEIERMVNRYGIKHITWLDDDLLFDERRTVALFREIADCHMDLTWDASNGIIAAALTQELLNVMVESGCIGFNMGIESGSPKILREVHKPGTVESFFKAKKLLDAYPHLFIKGFLMMGFPHETLGQMKETTDLAINLGFDWYPLQILNPLPSTEIYKTMAEEGLLEDNLQTSTQGWMAGVFQSLNLRRREQGEKENAREFFDPFQGKALDIIPRKEDLGDLWFLMDYRINYEPILAMENRAKLENKRKILCDICDRISKDNALGNLFLAIAERKLGNPQEADRRLGMARKYLSQSEYWQKRFSAFGLSEFLDDSTPRVA